jgi:hypothetical protein
MSKYRFTVTGCAGVSPKEAFDNAVANKVLAPTDMRRANVKAELLDGARQSVGYYHTVDRQKAGSGVLTVNANDKGYFEVMAGCDPNYPGVDVEFISNSKDAENKASRPRVVFEYPKDGGLRMLIWANRDSEDYTDIIEFDRNGNRK